MPAGRPPVPNEVKRRRGNPGHRALPAETSVVALRSAEDGKPEIPEDLGLAGQQLWAQIWQDGITWVSPQSDLQTAQQACRLVDDLERARFRYRATTDPADGRMVVQLHGSLSSALGALGFDPVSRTKLGVAEVRKQTDFEKLMAKRAATK